MLVLVLLVMLVLVVLHSTVVLHQMQTALVMVLVHMWVLDYTHIHTV